MKRYRTPKAKPGQLKVQYGKLPHENPDIVFCWGDGTSKRDSNLLNCVLAGNRMQYGDKMQVVFGPSLLEELEARGYDLTTLKFSIEKKAQL